MYTLIVLGVVSAVLLAIAIVAWVITNKTRHCPLLLFVGSVAFATTSIVALLCVGVASIAKSHEKVKYNVLDQRYEQLIDTYYFERLHTRTDFNAWLMEAYDYNKEVIELKENANSKWFDCFVNKDRVEELKLIEFEDGFVVLNTGA